MNNRIIKYSNVIYIIDYYKTMVHACGIDCNMQDLLLQYTYEYTNTYKLYDISTIMNEIEYT